MCALLLQVTPQVRGRCARYGAGWTLEGYWEDVDRAHRQHIDEVYREEGGDLEWLQAERAAGTFGHLNLDEAFVTGNAGVVTRDLQWGGPRKRHSGFHYVVVLGHLVVKCRGGPARYVFGELVTTIGVGDFSDYRLVTMVTYLPPAVLGQVS